MWLLISCQAPSILKNQLKASAGRAGQAPDLDYFDYRHYLQIFKLSSPPAATVDEEVLINNKELIDKWKGFDMLQIL